MSGRRSTSGGRRLRRRDALSTLRDASSTMTMPGARSTAGRVRRVAEVIAQLNGVVAGSQSAESLATLDLRMMRRLEPQLPALFEAAALAGCVRSLTIVSSSLTSKAAVHIAAALRTNTTITSLNLSHNNLKSDGVAKLAEGLQENRTLTSLSLAANKVGPEGVEALVNALIKTGSSGQLSVLDLSENQLGEEGGRLLARLVTSGSSGVSSLLVARAQLGKQGGAALGAALASAGTTLKVVDLARNGLDAEVGRVLFESLASATCGVTSFACSGNPQLMDDGDTARALADLLTAPGGKLEQLEAKGIGLDGDSGSRVVIDALGRNTSLVSLDLSHNNLGAAAGRAVADLLRSNASLLYVDLESVSLGTEGMQALAESLPDSRSIEELDLSRNGIDPEAGPALRDGLRANGSLRVLRLDQNQLGPAGGADIATALPDHASLERVYLSSNALDDATVAIIIVGVLTDRLHCEVQLNGNTLDASTLEAAKKALRGEHTVAMLAMPTNTPSAIVVTHTGDVIVHRDVINESPDTNADPPSHHVSLPVAIDADGNAVTLIPDGVTIRPLLDEEKGEEKKEEEKQGGLVVSHLCCSDSRMQSDDNSVLVAAVPVEASEGGGVRIIAFADKGTQQRAETAQLTETPLELNMSGSIAVATQRTSLAFINTSTLHVNTVETGLHLLSVSTHYASRVVAYCGYDYQGRSMTVHISRLTEEWAFANDRELVQTVTSASPMRVCLLSAGQTVVVLFTDGFLVAWEAKSGTVIASQCISQDAGFFAFMAPLGFDGTGVCAVSLDERVHVWRPLRGATKLSVISAPGANVSIQSISLLNDRLLVNTFNDETGKSGMMMWDPESAALTADDGGGDDHAAVGWIVSHRHVQVRLLRPPDDHPILRVTTPQQTTVVPAPGWAVAEASLSTPSLHVLDTMDECSLVWTTQEAVCFARFDPGDPATSVAFWQTRIPFSIRSFFNTPRFYAVSHNAAGSLVAVCFGGFEKSKRRVQGPECVFVYSTSCPKVVDDDDAGETLAPLMVLGDRDGGSHVYGVCFHPARKGLLASSDAAGNLIVRDVLTSGDGDKRVAEFCAPSRSAVFDLCVVDSDVLVGACADGSVCSWNFYTGELLSQYVVSASGRPVHFAVPLCGGSMIAAALVGAAHLRVLSIDKNNDVSASAMPHVLSGRWPARTTALHEAVRSGSLSRVEDMLQRHFTSVSEAFPPDESPRAESALDLAIRKGHETIVRAIVDHISEQPATGAEWAKVALCRALPQLAIKYPALCVRALQKHDPVPVVLPVGRRHQSIPSVDQIDVAGSDVLSPNEDVWATTTKQAETADQQVDPLYEMMLLPSSPAAGSGVQMRPVGSVGVMAPVSSSSSSYSPFASPNGAPVVDSWADEDGDVGFEAEHVVVPLPGLGHRNAPVVPSAAARPLVGSFRAHGEPAAGKGDARRKSLLSVAARRDLVDVLSTEAMHHVIQLKWHQFGRRRFFRDLVLYMSFVALYVFVTLWSDGEAWHCRSDGPAPDADSNDIGALVVRIGLAVASLAYLLGGMAQMVQTGFFVYWSNGWNTMDLIAFTLVPTSFAVRHACPVSSAITDSISAITAVVLFLKLLEYLRGFSGPGRFVRIVSLIIISMANFVLVLAIVFVGFSIGFYLVFREADSSSVGPNESEGWVRTGRVLLESYTLLVSGGDGLSFLESAPYPWVAYVLYVLYTSFASVVLLSLLVAQMSGVYEKVRANADNEWLLERAKMIVQYEEGGIEQLASYFPTYLHVRRAARVDRVRSVPVDERLDRLEGLVRQLLQNKNN